MRALTCNISLHLIRLLLALLPKPQQHVARAAPVRQQSAEEFIAAVQPMWEQLSQEQRLALLTVDICTLEQAAIAKGPDLCGRFNVADQ